MILFFTIVSIGDILLTWPIHPRQVLIITTLYMLLYFMPSNPNQIINQTLEKWNQ